MSCGYLITTQTHLIPAGTKGDVFIIQNNRHGVELRREPKAKREGYLNSKNLFHGSVFLIDVHGFIRCFKRNEMDITYHIFASPGVR